MNIDIGRAPEPAGDAPSVADFEVTEEQLGRPPRGVVAVVWRCPRGCPGVIKTLPRFDNGTLFPTVYYLIDPRYVAACSLLEIPGLMAEMTWRLGEDENLAVRYRAVHEACPADRTALGVALEIEGISVGGMPTRVKCLHVLVGYALVAGSGVNPPDDEVPALIRERIGGECCGEQA